MRMTAKYEGITLGIDIVFVNKMLSFVSTFPHIRFGMI